jgi:hypothetical protein
MTNGVHGSCNGLDGFDPDSPGHSQLGDRVQPEAHEVQEHIEVCSCFFIVQTAPQADLHPGVPAQPAHNAHQESARGPQQHAQEQEQAAKDPDTERDSLLSMRRRKKEEIARSRQEKRRRENERRLEGQRRENERRLEARRKAEEEAAVAAATAAARAQSESGEHSNRDRDEPAKDSVMKRRETKERKAGAAAVAVTAATKVDDDQNVDAQTAVVGPLEHDSGAAYLVITEEEHSESHLMEHVCALLPHLPCCGT